MTRRRLYNDPLRTNPMRFVGAVERAQAAARLVYPDYDEMERIGVEAARRDPQFRERLLASPDMALTAYRIGRELSGLPVPLSPDEIRAQQQAEAQARRDEQERQETEARAQREADRAARRAEAEERMRREQTEASAQALQEALAPDRSDVSRRIAGLDFMAEDADAPPSMQRET